MFIWLIDLISKSYSQIIIFSGLAYFQFILLIRKAVLMSLILFFILLRHSFISFFECCRKMPCIRQDSTLNHYNISFITNIFIKQLFYSHFEVDLQSSTLLQDPLAVSKMLSFCGYSLLFHLQKPKQEMCVSYFLKHCQHKILYITFSKDFELQTVNFTNTLFW